MGPLGIIWRGEILSYSSKIFVDSLYLCLPFTLYYFQRTKAKWTQENNNICNKYKSLHRKVHCLDHLSIFYLVCCKWNRETIKCSKPYYFMSNYICNVVEHILLCEVTQFCYKLRLRYLLVIIDLDILVSRIKDCLAGLYDSYEC